MIKLELIINVVIGCFIYNIILKSIATIFLDRITKRKAYLGYLIKEKDKIQKDIDEIIQPVNLPNLGDNHP